MFMVLAPDRLDVMRRNYDSPADVRGPDPAYSPGRYLAASAALLALFVAVLVAASYPVATAGAVGLALAMAPVARLAADYRDGRRADGRSREVCVPSVGVCVEV